MALAGDPRPGASVRARLGFALAGLAGVGALLVLLPPLTRSLWIARLLMRETSLAVSAAAVLARMLLHGAAGRLARASRAVSWLAMGVGLLPFVSVSSREKGGISMAAYLSWARPLPEVQIEKDVALDPTRPALTADVYRGAGPGPHAVVVAVHGGSWRGGDKGEGAHLWRYLAAAGYTVADVRYGLAPQQPFPAGIGDVKCLLGRLLEQAARFDVDPRRVALLGRSAGGQIALVAAYSSGDARLPPSCAVDDRPVQAVVSLYGPTDLVWGYENPMIPDVIHGNESLRLYLGGSPRDVPESYRLGSPLSWADGPLPSTLLIHGSGDSLVRTGHARRLAEGLRKKGKSVELLLVPFGDHGFDIRPGGAGEQLARRAVLRFLGEGLGVAAR